MRRWRSRHRVATHDAHHTGVDPLRLTISPRWSPIAPAAASAKPRRSSAGTYSAMIRRARLGPFEGRARLPGASIRRRSAAAIVLGKHSGAWRLRAVCGDLDLDRLGSAGAGRNENALVRSKRAVPVGRRGGSPDRLPGAPSAMRDEAMSPKTLLSDIRAISAAGPSRDRRRAVVLKLFTYPACTP